MSTIIKRFIPFVFFILTALYIYVPSLSFELVYLDDHVWIKDYGWYLNRISNLPSFFLKPDLISSIFYRPVLNISFMIDALLTHGDSLIVYRITNLILHTSNVILVYTLLKLLKYDERSSFKSAAFFLCHPVLVQAVVWIPGRTDSLLAFFVLISFILFIKSQHMKSLLWFGLHLIFFLLALFTKETAVVIPFMLLLYRYLIDNESQKGGTFPKGQMGWWVVILGIWFILRGLILKGGVEQTWPEMALSFIFNLPALVSYWGKIIIPINLSVLPILKNLSLVWGGVSVIVVIMLLFFSKEKRINYVALGFLWFLAFLLPSLVLSFLKHEYRVYLPLLGVIIILLETDLIKWMLRNVKWSFVFIALIALLSHSARVYSFEYQDRFTFWNNAVKNSPHSPLAHRNLGAMLYLEGNLTEAEELFLKAKQINPFEPMVNNNLGLIYMNRNEYRKAFDYFSEEIRINPTYANAFFNLGILMFKTDHINEAIQAWEQTIKLQPKYVEAYHNLAAVYLAQKNFEKVKQYVRALNDLGAPIPQPFLRYSFEKK